MRFPWNEPQEPALMMETARIWHRVNEDPTRWRIERLAEYNSERQRGIVHTRAWEIFMRQEQEWFDGARRRNRK